MKHLYITEKPSVAEGFAAVLGLKITKADKSRGYAENNDSIVSWCYGHLVTMEYPEAYDPAYKSWRVEHLPIIPREYKYTVIDSPGVKKQFDVLKLLLHRPDVELIYSCTDSGREGEYIFRLVYQQSGSEKPVKRVWVSAQTEEAISKGIEQAKDIREYDSLSRAAYCRAKEDWLFGMNFSRLYTCQYGKLLASRLQEQKRSVIAIGRVMTCVLGLVVEREWEIRNFVPRVYYGISGSFLSPEHGVSYQGKWQPGSKAGQEPAAESESQEKYLTLEDARNIIDSLQDRPAMIKKVEVKLKKEPPPLLFNLAELQSEANKKFKLPVDQTLEIAQSLYEKKMISYPRTDSRVLSTEVVGEIPKILNGLYGNPAFREQVQRIKEFGRLTVNKSSKRFVDDSKVTDHYAIIPTYVSGDLSRLEANSRNLYQLIVRRFLAIFYPAAEYNTVKVETVVENQIFVTNSKTLQQPGWKEVYEVTAAKNEEEISTSPLHLLSKKEKVTVTALELEQKETKPPSRFSDASLILTMEKAGKYIENEELREQIKTCGIGTSATRSGIIKKLEDIGYIKIQPKTRIVTPQPKGEAIVELVRLSAKELLNPTLTASWEKGLFMLQNNEITEEHFEAKLNSYISRTIVRVKSSRGAALRSLPGAER